MVHFPHAMHVVLSTPLTVPTLPRPASSIAEPLDGVDMLEEQQILVIQLTLMLETLEKRNTFFVHVNQSLVNDISCLSISSRIILDRKFLLIVRSTLPSNLTHSFLSILIKDIDTPSLGIVESLMPLQSIQLIKR